MPTAVSADSMGPGNENAATAGVLTDNVLLEIYMISVGSLRVKTSPFVTSGNGT